MGKPNGSVTRVLMAKRLATRWVATNATPEHRLVVLAGFGSVQNLPSLMRAFRDSKVRIAGMDPILDLVVTHQSEKMILKSRNKRALRDLDVWLVDRGCETGGIW